MNNAGVKTEQTCANMSFIASLVSASPLPSMRKSRKIFTCTQHFQLRSASQLHDIIGEAKNHTLSPVAFIPP